MEGRRVEIRVRDGLITEGEHKKVLGGSGTVLNHDCGR